MWPLYRFKFSNRIAHPKCQNEPLFLKMRPDKLIFHWNQHFLPFPWQPYRTIFFRKITTSDVSSTRTSVQNFSPSAWIVFKIDRVQDEKVTYSLCTVVCWTYYTLLWRSHMEYIVFGWAFWDNFLNAFSALTRKVIDQSLRNFGHMPNFTQAFATKNYGNFSALEIWFPW